MLTATFLIMGFNNAHASVFDWFSVAGIGSSNSLIVSLSSSLTSRPNTKNEPAKIKELTLTVTAYSSTPDQTDDDPFIMANGHRVHDGAIATNFLPFGTKIRIPELYGNKIFTVEDRMNKRFPHRIDIWFPDRKTVDDFGLQILKIQIINS